MRNERKGKNQGEADVVCREAGAIHNWWLPMHRLIFWHSERYINYILSAYTNTVISMPDLDIVQKHFLTQGFPGNSGFPCCRKSNKQELFSSNYNRFSLCYHLRVIAIRLLPHQTATGKARPLHLRLLQFILFLHQTLTDWKQRSVQKSIDIFSCELLSNFITLTDWKQLSCT